MSTGTGSKPLLMLLMIISAAIAFTGSGAAKDGVVSVAVPAGEYAVEQTALGHEVHMEGYGRLLVPGAPNLPSRIFAVALPPMATVTAVTVDKGEEAVLPGTYRIPPCPMPRVTGEEDPEVVARHREIYEANHEAFYGEDDPYPSTVGAFLLQGGYRKYNLADVRITPFTYHPGSGKLVHHSKLTIHVTYTLPDVIHEDEIVHDDLPRTEAQARDILLNYDQARSWYTGGTSSGGRGLHDLVIITLGSLTSAVQPLIDWETANGRTVHVATIAWISYNYPGYDLQEKIRNFLRDKYPSGEWGIEDVLLVGHYDDVPMRRCAQDTGYGQPETDFYYAELSFPDSQSWDIDVNRKWGEDHDPNDFYAEVNIGRIPWSDPATVEHICKKSAAFDSNDDPSFKKNILLLGAYFWDYPDPETDNAVLMELKTDPANLPWMADWTRMRLYEKNSEHYSSYACDYPLHNRNAVDVWSKGKYAFVNWAGHGNPYGCHILGMGAGYFITGSDGTCFNEQYPAIICANACSNSDTDDTNIGQLMLKRGAVGFLGATKVSWGILGWSDPYHGCGSSMDYFFTYYTTSGDYSQGAGLQKALQHMYNYGLFYFVKYEMFEWSSLWGSPTLGLVPRAPLSLCLPAELPEGLVLPGAKTRIPLEILDGVESYVPGSGLLHYRFDPGAPFSTAAFNDLGGGHHEAVLPNTMPGDEPEFYFSIQGDGGSTLTFPYDAPNEVCSFEVGYLDVLMRDDFEKESGWTTEDYDIQNGEWERADPGETCVQPDDDHSETGTMCFVTGKEGGSIGYDDLDGGPTYLISPTLDLSAGDLDIGYHLWFHQSCYGLQQPFEVHVSNDDGASWTTVMEFMHRPGWNFESFKVSDHVTPNASVKVRFKAIDNPNDACVEALIDDFIVARRMDAPPLWADAYSIPVSTGAVIDLYLEAGIDYANRPYLMLGSISGTSPGTPLPGGEVLPLNWDAFTNIILYALGSPMFHDFMGSLDSTGCGNALLDSLGPLDPYLAGMEIYFAYVLGPNPYYVSNAITLTLDP